MRSKSERRDTRKGERGQIVVMGTLSLTLLFGMVALAVELGWALYVRTEARAATDAAALGAASQALSNIGQSAAATCGTTVRCQSLSSCPASGNLQSGCLYAQQNGFTPQGAGSRQTMQVGAGTTLPVPGVANVPGVVYWTQAAATQSMPPLFSRMLSGAGLTTGVRSTAAIYPHSVTPSLFLLNRSSDCFASLLNLGLVCGEDFLSLGFTRVTAGGGIYMSSTNGTSTVLPNVAAATTLGSANVSSPFTYIMDNGGVDALGTSNWSSAPQNGFADGEDFRDPMRGKGQPPVPSGLPEHPVPGGIITSSLLGGATVLPPGRYFATNPLTGAALGTPITIAGDVTFSDGNSPPCGGFCNYVFFGGLVTGALTTTTFSPGRYVFAGAAAVAGAPGVALMAGVNSVVKDMTPLVGGKITQNTDAGEIFIFTDSNYSGLQLPVAIQNAGLSLPQVQAGIQGGIGYSVTLHGLNKNSSAIPDSLQTFSPVLFWQDQANTTLSYNPDGSLNTTCGSVCGHILSVPGSQEMILMASRAVNLFGTIYSPRAAWVTVVGLLPGDTLQGPLQIIAGSLQVALNTNVNLTALPSPMTRMTVSLIQ